jgi:hypothetical protein
LAAAVVPPLAAGLAIQRGLQLPDRRVRRVDATFRNAKETEFQNFSGGKVRAVA